ncbi:hypothetical protein N9N67_01320 [Bacteriovoracaceae bacterium]|nr:hypothetical protein [Bacteriovoracaceae bacterium]
MSSNNAREYDKNDLTFITDFGYKYAVIPLIGIAIIGFAYFIFSFLNYYYLSSAYELKETNILVFVHNTLKYNYVNLGLFVMTYLVANFAVGFSLTYFLLAPFRKLAEHMNVNNPEELNYFPKDALRQNTLLFDSIYLLLKFFKAKKRNETDAIAIPEYMQDLSLPRLSKANHAFLYALYAIIFCISGIGLYSFTKLLFHQTLLKLKSEYLSSPIILEIIEHQPELVIFVSTASCFVVSLYYFHVLRKLVNSVSSVNYCYLRDIRKIIQGSTHHRIILRNSDPGRFFANRVNQLCDKKLNAPVNVVNLNSDLPPPHQKKTASN